MTTEGTAGQGGTTTATESGGGSAGQSTTTTPSNPASAAAAPGGAGAEAPPEFAPNFKYKYVNAEGKDAEGEIDDMFKPLVKSAEVEKKIREFHEKSNSLDFIKSGRTKAQNEFSQVSSELTDLKSGIDQLRNFVAAKDFDAFFDALEIPQQVIMEYALQKAQYAKLPPEQQRAYDQSVATRRANMQFQQQNQFLQQQHVTAVQKAKSLELDGVLARPEINAMIAAFDTKAGRPGAFRSEAIRRGQHAFATSGQDLSAEAVVMEMATFYGNFLTPTAPGGGTAPAIVQPNGKPTLPNIAGKGTSPAKQVPKSIADLKKRAAELAAQDR